MFKIVHAAFIAPGIKRFVIEAPRIACKQNPGQFVILRLFELGERIPLTITIERSDSERGTINIVVQSAGKTTHLFNLLETGDYILDVVGPLGKPSEIKNYGTVAVMGDGVGTAMAYPTAAALKRAGNRVIAIVGARTKKLVILEREMSEVSDALMITTDDGRYAEKSFVTDNLQELIAHRTQIDLVLAVGPIPMMKAVADATRPANIRTIVSLNPIMIDGTGMCGGCRVLVDGESEFACVDDPEFEAHRVDFDVLVQRNAMYVKPSGNRWRNSSRNPIVNWLCCAKSTSGFAPGQGQRMTPPAKMASVNPLTHKERMKVPRQQIARCNRSERVPFSTFDPVRFDSPSHCDLCTSRAPLFHYEHTVDEAARLSPKRGFHCGLCASRLLASLENAESRSWAEEEASLEADDVDARDLAERRLAAFGEVGRR